MQTAIMNRFLLLFPLLLVGCETLMGIETADPSEFSGSYRLVSVSGAPLPAVMEEFYDDGRHIEIFAEEGTVTLTVDGLVQETTRRQHYVDGATGMNETITRQGRWVTDQEQIDVTWEGDASDYTTFLYDSDTGELELEENPSAGLRARLYQKID